jgi:hypothetical protein
MKKLLIVLASLAVLNTIAQSDNQFYNFGWEKMVDNGYDYQTIYEKTYCYFDTLTDTNHVKMRKHFIRWNAYWANNVYSNDEERDAGKRGMFYHHKAAVATLFGTSVCQATHPSSNWESWGFKTLPANYWSTFSPTKEGMGVMWCVKIDTSDPSLQTIYAGSPIGGLWKTTDQGINWANITDVTNIPGLNISDIAIDPRNNQHLLVST